MGSLRATTLVTLLLFLGAMAGSAQAQIGAAFGDLTLSADPLQAQPYNENIAGFEQFQFFVMIGIDFADDGRPEENGTNGFNGWEASLTIPADVTVLARELAPVGSTNAGQDDNFIVTTGSTVLASSTPFAVATYTAVLNMADPPTDLTITMGAATPSAGDLGLPAWIEANNGFIHPFATWFDSSFVVNCAEDPVCGGNIGEPLGDLYVSASPTEPVGVLGNPGAFQTFFFYIVIDIDFADVGRGGENPFNGVKAWEAAITVPGELTLLGAELFPLTSLNVGVGNNFIVGTGSLLTAAATPTKVAEISAIFTQPIVPEDLVVSLVPPTPSTGNAGVPLWIEWSTNNIDPFATWESDLVINCVNHPACSTPIALQGRDGRWEDDRVRLRWRLEGSLPRASFEVHRRELPDGAYVRLSEPVSASGEDAFLFEDFDVRPSTAYAYRVVMLEGGNATDSFELQVTTPSFLDALVLAPNRPNPFNPRTTIQFEVPSESPIQLDVYDARGRWVVNLVERVLPAGTHDVVWNGRDAGGENVTSGVYFYRLRSNDRELTRRMLLVR